MSRQFLDQITASYIAGIVDGEGCFYIGKSDKPTGTYYQPQFKIVLIDERTIAWIAEKMGRDYTHQKANPGKNHKDTYTVRVSSRQDLIDFIPQILPYLILKRAVAINILEFCKSRPAYGKNNPEGENKMYLHNKALNRVGVLL